MIQYLFFNIKLKGGVNMINLWKKEDLKLLLEYPKEIVDNVNNVINILEESYGDNRKITDDGGYVCIIEDIEEVEYLKVNILRDKLNKQIVFRKS